MNQLQSKYSTYNGQSMLPIFQPGDGLIVEEYSAFSEIQIGDVITYRHPLKETEVVHRIIEICGNTIKTQGDNNEYQDNYELTFKDIQGKVTSLKRKKIVIEILNGPQGIKYLKKLRRKQKINSFFVDNLRPLYNIIAKTGWFYGLLKFQCLKFNGPYGDELQLMRKGCFLGRKNPQNQNWEISFPYRLFVDEKKLPEIPLGPLSALARHLLRMSVWKWLAIIFFYYNFITITFNLLQHPILDKRVQVFAGIFFLLSVISALIAGRKELSSFLSNKELWIISILTLLGAISGFLCSNYPSGLYRMILVLLTSCGGFLCSRILLRNKVDQYIFFGFNLLMLSALILLGILGRLSFGHVNFLWESLGQFFPNPQKYDLIYFLSVHLHYWVDLIILLSIAPLSMILSGKKKPQIIGTGFLFLSYVVLIFTRLRTIILLPLFGAISFFLYCKFNLKKTVAILLIIFFGSLVLYKSCPEKINNLSMKHASIAYRLENYPFSLAIALQHPVLGIGLRAPRTKFLSNYQLHFNHLSDYSFAERVKNTVTSENIILTFLAGAGFPFTIIFFTATLGIIINGLINCKKSNSDKEIFHPTALILCLILCLIHGMLYDIFLFSRVSWYFFIFLGLIPLKRTGEKIAEN